jgi:alpha-N-arabinofuranosidase
MTRVVHSPDLRPGGHKVAREPRSRSPVEIEASLAGITAKATVGETLTAPKVDRVNTFDAPNTVVPKPVSAKVQNGKLALTLAPKSVTVIAVEQ